MTGERSPVPSLPIIDLTAFVSSASDAQKARVALQLREACVEVGFFYLTGHGIERRDFDQLMGFGHRFFELPVEQKMSLHYARSPWRTGYFGVGGEGTGGDAQGTPDLRERFRMNRDLFSDETPSASAASAAMSEVNSSGAAMRRSLMPVRVMIHSLDVSTIFSKSALVRTRLGT